MVEQREGFSFTLDTIMQEYYQFLNDLRESGEINMFGASPFLRREWPDLTQTQARDVLMSWMDQFESDG